jgi:predicted RNA methylase
LMHEQVHTYGMPSVLDVACGPCRDVSESLLLNGPASFHCVDLDAQALEYARSVVARTFHDCRVVQKHTHVQSGLVCRSV